MSSLRNGFDVLHDQGKRADSRDDPRTSEQMKMMSADLLEWDTGRFWPFTTYGFSNMSSVPGFDDLSPEELREKAYTHRKNGKWDEYITFVTNLTHKVDEMKRSFKIPSVEVKKMDDLLKQNRKEGVTPSPASFDFKAAREASVEEAPSTLFGQANPAAPKTEALFDFRSVSGGQSSGSLFGQANPAAPKTEPLFDFRSGGQSSESLFGQASATGQPLGGIFAQLNSSSQSSTGIFESAGPPNNRGLFGQANTTSLPSGSIFAASQSVGENAGQLNPTNQSSLGVFVKPNPTGPYTSPSGGQTYGNLLGQGNAISLPSGSIFAASPSVRENAGQLNATSQSSPGVFVKPNPTGPYTSPSGGQTLGNLHGQANAISLPSGSIFAASPSVRENAGQLNATSQSSVFKQGSAVSPFESGSGISSGASSRSNFNKTAHNVPTVDQKSANSASSDLRSVINSRRSIQATSTEQLPPKSSPSAQSSPQPNFSFNQVSVPVNSGNTQRFRQFLGAVDAFVYTPVDKLDSDDLEAYRADKFELGRIPLMPPPRELC